MAQASTARKTTLVERLEMELNDLVNRQIESPEFQALLTVPLTLQRARFEAKQMRLYVLNRRDCWAFVQGKAPFQIKKAIWQHEQDELISDARAGIDHVELATKEAAVLGLSKEEMESTEPTVGVQAALYAWIYLAQNLPWLGGITASHFLERRNNGAIVKGGGMSARWRRKLVDELNLDASLLINANVHVEADEGHSDLIWEAIAGNVVDEESYRVSLDGARQCAVIDRAFRKSLAEGLREIA